MTSSEAKTADEQAIVSPSSNDLRDHYCSLLQRALTRYEMETEVSYTPIRAVHAHPAFRMIVETGQKLLRRRSLEVVRVQPPDPTIRSEGKDWPRSAETMVGMKRLDNLRECLVQVFADGVPGDILEAGVWRGGASIFMRGVLLAYGETHRQSWVADSFVGLPEPGRYPADKGSVFHALDELAVSLEMVKANFAKYDLLDESVHFLKGWFEETLPVAPVDQLALLRLDGDMYSSTIQTLDALYDKVAIGGFIVVDDYGSIPSCKQATDDFRQRRGIEDPIVTVDSSGVYWRKKGEAS
jgi:O-methyltransferase